MRPVPRANNLTTFMCLEIRKPRTPGNFMICPGLYRDCLILLYKVYTLSLQEETFASNKLPSLKPLMFFTFMLTASVV